MGNPIVATETEISTALVAPDKDVAQMLRLVLSSRETCNNFGAVVRQDSDKAMRAVARYRDLGLSQKGAGTVLDLIVDELEAEDACKLMDEHLTEQQQVELIASFSDRGSSTAIVAVMERVIKAMLHDIQQTIELSDEPLDAGDSTYFTSEILLGWAQKLSYRDDFEEMLDVDMGDYTFKEYIALAVWLTNGAPKSRSGITDLVAGSFDDFGIEDDDGVEILVRLVPELGRQGFKFSSKRIARAQKRLSNAKKNKPQSDFVDQSAQAMKAAADLDIGI